MPDLHYLLLVAGMGLVTYLPRFLPLLLLSRKSLPRWLGSWLELVPPAILGALVAPSLFVSGTPRMFDLTRPDLFAALPTFAVAIHTRSLAATVLSGMLFYHLFCRLL